MRKILFRGKRFYDNKWVHGDLVHGFGRQKGLMWIWCEDKEYPTAISEFQIDPETVGQFTGMLDKNGKKIFEGDIVKYTSHLKDSSGSYVKTGPVIFSDYCFMPICYSDDNGPIEVIGNIHDNP